jgi:hypothetical protein
MRSNLFNELQELDQSRFTPKDTEEEEIEPHPILLNEGTANIERELAGLRQELQRERLSSVGKDRTYCGFWCQ